MCTMGHQTVEYDADELRRLWLDRTVRTCDIATRLGISTVLLYQHAKRMKLPPRGLPRGGIKDHPLPSLVDDGEPEPFDDAPAGDSLALSPWVAARVRALRDRFAAERGTRWEHE